MINIAPWKIFLTLAVCVLGIFNSLPNMLSADARSSLPSFLPSKTVNLGLDLRGGAHLLYDVDVKKVFKERADSMLQDARKSLRQAKIGYKRIGVIEGGVKVSLRKKDDGEAARKILRGLSNNLDVRTLEGGMQLEASLNEAGIKQLYDHTLSQSIEVVRRRIDELGTSEPIIQRQGESRILIQAPGADAGELKALVGTTAKLAFHLVKDPSASTGVGTKNFPFAQDGENAGRPDLTVERAPLITGEMLENAQYAQNQTGEHVISFRLNNTGARRFCDVSRKNVGVPFAIVLDSEVLSAPVIREAICGGQGQISGGFTVKSANDLSLLLRAGALPAEMSVIEERTVGPSLGADSVAAGKVAAMIGMVGVLVFMGLSYGMFGLMANVALIVNVVLIFALLSMLQATLTLPGIAGIVLTIGMAVDANVLIFERIREELRLGRSVVSAIDAGYGRAMSTIIDSNLTTLIAAAILFSFGTGPIKGFSVTLGVGIMTSFFTAIMVTRLMVIWWLKNNRNAKSLPI
jgi:preprotein translocase subunit SecD